MMSFAAPLALMVAFAEALVDWVTWIELNVAILYSLPLVLAAVSRNRRLLWTLTAVLVVVTFAVYFAQVREAEPFMRTAFFVDRTLAAFCILINAGILDAWMRSMEKIVLRDRAIESRNQALARANQQLVLKEQEITRKNEELDQRRIEAEAASMRKTQMLASLSHDIRTPIQAITLLSELVRRTAERPELASRIPALAQRLQSNAVSVVDFLSEVIDLASFDSGRVAVNSSEFSLQALIAEQCQRLLPLADEKSLKLVADAPDVQLWLLTDRVKLGRILSNLVSNAIKFTEGGTIRLHCGTCSHGDVFVRVTDTGCGMKPEYLEKVFGEYARVDQNSPAGASGWGLGLAISRRMVRLLGGDILVKSEWRVGSTFTIVLPASCRIPERSAA